MEKVNRKDDSPGIKALKWESMMLVFWSAVVVFLMLRDSPAHATAVKALFFVTVVSAVPIFQKHIDLILATASPSKIAKVIKKTFLHGE